ncbi:MAG: hypothetical protein EZS28_003887 [Streblomastix strix]|uniref:Uncharacterized protein n=1 Tax=Streblomastix strix TaxID=222440 RepID=A0A5J4X1I2_9EUKA|nr:MAG: hypothetical protein EZS28_003887 [Streblomastix strix]
MQKDPPDNHSDRYSTWTEDEAPQHHIATSQPKYPAQQTQRVQQIQVQPKQQAPAQIPKMKQRKDQPPNQDDIDELEIIQERLAALQKEKEELSIPDSDSDCIDLELDKDQRKLRERIITTGTVGQLTGLQPSPSAESPGLNAGLKPTEAGSISASNRERTEPQINEGHDDNADEEEDEQTDEAALNQNKDYKVNIISQPPVQENLGTQSQNIQGLNALNQMEKDDASPAPAGVREKPKKGKGSKKAKAEGFNAPAEQNQGSNAQEQTPKTSKTKAATKKGKKAAEEVKPEPKNAKEEGEEQQDP